MLMVLSAFGQSIEVHQVPFVPPCEPGTLLFGISKCPAIEEQGIFVHVKASGEFSAYQVTVDYRTASGEMKTAVETVPRRNDDGYHTAVFVIGRVKTGGMPGITIDGVAVKKLPSLAEANFNWIQRPNFNIVPLTETYSGDDLDSVPAVCSGRCFEAAMRWLRKNQ